jgi:DNA-binding response OmpR family regulator
MPKICFLKETDYYDGIEETLICEGYDVTATENSCEFHRYIYNHKCDLLILSVYKSIEANCSGLAIYNDLINTINKETNVLFITSDEEDSHPTLSKEKTLTMPQGIDNLCKTVKELSDPRYVK